MRSVLFHLDSLSLDKFYKMASLHFISQWCMCPLFTLNFTFTGIIFVSCMCTEIVLVPTFCVVFKIRWLLEDEIVSALRHSWTISLSTLQKVTQHILSSTGRPHCHCEDVPLQFVFGPEQSMEKFKEARSLPQFTQACLDWKNANSALLFPLYSGV